MDVPGGESKEVVSVETSVVRTTSSISEKISKKPFISGDLEAIKKPLIIKNSHKKTPIVIMKELAKPSKASLVNDEKEDNRIYATDLRKIMSDQRERTSQRPIQTTSEKDKEAVVVSIEKKRDRYKIKKRRKVASSSTSDDDQVEDQVKARPNIDPRERTTMKTTTNPIEITTYRRPFIPTPVPSKKPITSEITSETIETTRKNMIDKLRKIIDDKHMMSTSDRPTSEKTTLKYGGKITSEEESTKEQTTSKVKDTIEKLPTAAPLVSQDNIYGVFPTMDIQKVSLKDESTFLPENLEIGSQTLEPRSLNIFPTARNRRTKKGRKNHKPRKPSLQPPKPRPTLVVKPIRNKPPTKVRLYYNKKKRKTIPPPPPVPVGPVSTPPKLKGYELTYKAFESNKETIPFTSKPLTVKPHPSLDTKPLVFPTVGSPKVDYKDSIDPSFNVFQEEPVDVTVPQFPDQLNFDTNFHGFGLKIGVTEAPSVSFRTSKPIKTNPIGVVKDDNKWHPVALVTKTTQKPIIREASGKTIGDFIGKSKATEDSVAKLLVKDPYSEQQVITATERIDKITYVDDGPLYRSDHSFATKDYHSSKSNHEYTVIEDHSSRPPIQDVPYFNKDHSFEPTYHSSPNSKHHSFTPEYHSFDIKDHFVKSPSYSYNQEEFKPIIDQHSFRRNSDLTNDPYKTAFSSKSNLQGRKLHLPVIKKGEFPQIVKHISTYNDNTSRVGKGITSDLTDFGAASGNHGAFGWYSDHPVHEGLFH